MPSLEATFLRMLAAPLQSALIRSPFPALYNPRSTLLPDGFQLAGFAPPNTGMTSWSRNEHLEV